VRGDRRGGAAVRGRGCGHHGRPCRDFQTALLPSLREAYRAELERFAETLRPRFESGELRAEREGDYRRIPGTTGWSSDCFTHDSPRWEIERLAEDYFGVTFTERPMSDGGGFDGDSARAHLVLAASPHAGFTGEGAEHPCDHARESVAWDVIALARDRGWYVPTPDEFEDPALEVFA
jgi:hypothetical protein